jgi:predicted AAA+ superfamily ATPase
MYLLRRIDAWSRNRLNRLIKTPKLQFIDSGLLTTLLDLTAGEVRQDRTRFGNVLETFVFSEMLKHAATADDDYRLMYYRDADQIEVDVVIENGAGKLVCVEVKAAATIRESDLRGLKKLAGIAGDQFKMGVLLYCLLQDKNGESCKLKFHKVATGNSIKLQVPFAGINPLNKGSCI